MTTETEEIEQAPVETHHCELMAPSRWTIEACRKYAASWSETCRNCPGKPVLRTVRDPLRDYANNPLPNRTIEQIYGPKEPTMKDTTKNLPPVAAKSAQTRIGICVKCDEERTIVAKGMCTGCGYGPNKNLTRDQVLAKKAGKEYTPPAKGTIPPSPAPRPYTGPKSLITPDSKEQTEKTETPIETLEREWHDESERLRAIECDQTGTEFTCGSLPATSGTADDIKDATTGAEHTIDRRLLKTPKPPKTATCFFCAKEEEHNNNVGDIAFSDGEHTRKIYVCHYCASESLQNLLTNADPTLLPSVLGELMYKRALDSRAA